MAYANLSKAELQKVFDELSAEYKGYQAKNLALNMARGKPSAKQLELALGVLEALKARNANLRIPTVMTAVTTVFGTVCRR